MSHKLSHEASPACLALTDREREPAGMRMRAESLRHYSY
jgi:hypothetical protein